MDNYEKHANLYSAWAALIVPSMLLVYICYDALPRFFNLYRLLSAIVPVTVAVASVGYFFREGFRGTSKFLFQAKLFGRDETQMPTTDFLLYSNKEISTETKDIVRQKMAQKYGYRMATREEELADVASARHNIAGAVGYMRNATRGDLIVKQSNWRYGFQRNQLGGLVWSALFCGIAIVFGYETKQDWFVLSIVANILVLLQIVFAFFLMVEASKSYARTLITQFASLS